MIVGKIYFLLVRIKIKYMEIAILKRESVGNGPNLFNENETIAKYEIMDGAPVKGNREKNIQICIFDNKIHNNHWFLITQFRQNQLILTQIYEILQVNFF